MTVNITRLRLNNRVRFAFVALLVWFFVCGSLLTVSAQRRNSQWIARQAVEDALIRRFGQSARPVIGRAYLSQLSSTEDRVNGTVSYRANYNNIQRDATWECIVNRSTGQVRDLRFTGADLNDDGDRGRDGDRDRDGDRGRDNDRGRGDGRPGYGRRTVTCGSEDGRRHECRANTVGGVRLLNKQSDAPCIYGRTWGYGTRGIWVSRGCRAEFEIGSGYFGGYNGGNNTQKITCSSEDMRRHYCRANIRGGVRLINQESNADCVYGRTWGYNGSGIWVDRGCRGEFEITR